MNSKFLTILLALLEFQLALGEQVLTSPIVTNWGDWGEFQYCPEGTKVIGFQLKTEAWDAWDVVVDDTCLNAVKFFCGHPAPGGGQPVDTITSLEGGWGKWGKIFWCDGLGFARGFMLRSLEANTAFIDETASQNLRILCMEGTQYIEGDGEGWGEWTAPRICKETEYICGLQTQVEAPQAGDDTSMNNLRVKCCDLSKQELISYGLLNSTQAEVGSGVV